MNRTIIALIFAFAGAHSACAQGNEKTIGNWQILISKDAMTDKGSCVGYYKGNKRIQLTGTSFAVSMRGEGGASAYILRYGDNPPNDLQLATDIEKQIDAIVLQGPEFQAITTSHRFRMRILTILSTQEDFDIDTSDMQPALAFLNGPNCS